MEYRAITKTDSSTELTHWKYIKRERKNGKWKYWYENTVDKISDKLGLDEDDDKPESLNIKDDKVVDEKREQAKDQKIARNAALEKEAAALKAESDRQAKEKRGRMKAQKVMRNVALEKEAAALKAESERRVKEKRKETVGKVLDGLAKAGANFVSEALGINSAKKMISNVKTLTNYAKAKIETERLIKNLDGAKTEEEARKNITSQTGNGKRRYRTGSGNRR